MYSLKVIAQINSEIKIDPPRVHPRISALRLSIEGMPVEAEYKLRLYAALDKYAEDILSRPYYQPSEGFDDLEALQQVTLGDWNEETLTSYLANLYPEKN